MVHILQVRKVTIQINSRKGSAPSASSNGPSSSSGPRARSSASSNGPALPVRETDNSTPEQRELVNFAHAFRHAVTQTGLMHTPGNKLPSILSMPFILSQTILHMEV